jgi:hypothetical protein
MTPFVKVQTRNKAGFTIVNAMQVTKIIPTPDKEEVQIFLQGEEHPIYVSGTVEDTINMIEKALGVDSSEDFDDSDGEAKTSTDEGKMVDETDPPPADGTDADEGPQPPQKPKRTRR